MCVSFLTSLYFRLVFTVLLNILLLTTNVLISTIQLSTYNLICTGIAYGNFCLARSRIIGKTMYRAFKRLKSLIKQFFNGLTLFLFFCVYLKIIVSLVNLNNNWKMQLDGKNFQILQIIINNTYEVNLKTPLFI